MVIKDFFRNRKVLVISVIILTLLIIKGVIALIYIKDEPKIIPEKVREEVRAGIKETVAAPLEVVIPSVGRAVREAAYTPVSQSANSSNNTTSETANWQTYKSEEFGFEVKYPNDYIVYEENEVISITNKDNNDLGIWFYVNQTNLSTNDWWLIEKQRYSAVFSETEEIINGNKVLVIETTEGLGEVHYILSKNGILLDVLKIGPAKLMEIVKTIKF